MSNDNPHPPQNRLDPSSISTTASSTNSQQPNSNSNSNSNAQPPASTSTPTKQNEDPSLLSRIQSSATNLLRDTITNPNAHALGSDLGQLHSAALSDKATSSSASRWQQGGVNGEFLRSGASSSSSPAEVRDGPGVGDANANIPLGEGFRSAQNQNAANNIPGLESFDQEQFQTSYGDIDVNIDTDDVRKGKGKEKGKSPIISSDLRPQFNNYGDEEDATPGQYVTAWNQATTHSNAQGIDNINSRDGAEVVTLLSDPSFQPEFADDNDDFSLRDEDTPAPLTADEIRILDSFRRQNNHGQRQQPPSSTSITPHSLIPDIDTFLAENENHIQNNNAAALRDVVLYNLPGAEDWMAVNDRYQDEVWGYLRPALEAASQEIEETKKADGSKPEREGPAVRRLKMILRHMQS